MKTKAIEVLRVWMEREKEYDRVNSELRKLNPDFPVVLNVADPHITTMVISFLDYILGDTIASYFLYECSTMKGGGKITENGKEYPIRTIEDVKAYVERVK